MTEEQEPYVFDSGPLSHFAQAGWLGLLREIPAGQPAWIPESVRREVDGGLSRYAHLRAVLEADWLVVRSAIEIDEIVALGRYTSRLVGDDQRKNLGECEVLAMAEVHRGVAVVDDGAARKLAAEAGVRVMTSLGLLCELVSGGHLGMDLASAVADSLLATEYRLPIAPGGFRAWAIENDYLPYDGAPLP